MARDGKDEAWVGVQNRTFTRWCNSHLSDRQLKIDSLSGDLQSGVLLAQLLEIISDKQIKHYAKPGFKIKMIENLNASLQFLAKEGIKVVNIGPEDVYEGNLRLILGLIWTIILRYQINKGIEQGSPKWLLLEWVKAQVRPYGIPEPRDFKTSWIDGQTISALCDSLEPGVFPKGAWTADPLTDTVAAMNRAEQAYQIPQLMDAPDMCETPEELSIMTYVAAFRDYQERQARRMAHLMGIPNARASSIEGPGLHEATAHESAQFQIIARNFQNTPLKAGGHHFRVTLRDAAGGSPRFDLVDHQNGTYGVTYVPTESGVLHIAVEVSETPDVPIAEHPDDAVFAHLTNSPASPNVKSAVSAEHTTAAGPGLEHPYADVETHFVITSKDKNGAVVPRGGQLFAVAIDGPSGHIAPAPVDHGDGTYTVTYTPTEKGAHTVAVQFEGHHIHASPFNVGVKPSVVGARCTAKGAGLHEPYTDNQTHFVIQARDKHGDEVNEGGAPVHVAISGPSGDFNAHVHDNNDGTYNVTYTPTEKGTHQVTPKVTGVQGEQVIEGAPFNVEVKASVNGSRCTAEGPALNTPYTDVETHFVVTARDKHGEPVHEGGRKVEVHVTGPSGDIHPAVVDNGNGTYNVTFTYTEKGEHHVAVTADGISGPDTVESLPIHGSPFNVGVKPSVVGARCTAKGDGLHEPYTDNQTHFVIQARDKHGDEVNEGGAPVHVAISGPSGDFNAHVHDNNDGTYNVTYTPTEKGTHQVTPKVTGVQGEQVIEGAPFNVEVKASVNGSRCTAEGPALNTPYTDVETHFVVTARDKHGEPVHEGGRKVEVHVTGPSGDIHPAVVDNGNGTYNVTFTYTEKGEHHVAVTADGISAPDTVESLPITGSPFNVGVKPSVVGARCTAKGAGLHEPYTDNQTHFVIQARDKHGDEVNEGGAPVHVAISGPSGDFNAHVHDNNDGTYNVTYTPTEKGTHQVTPKVTGVQGEQVIEGAPFNVEVKASVNGSRCTAEGPALNTPYTDVETHFVVTARDKHGEPVHEGGRKVEVHVTGPSGDIHPAVVDNGNGTYNVTFTYTEKGEHHVAVTADGISAPDTVESLPITGSPFHVNVHPTALAAHSTAEGPGVTTGVNLADHPTQFVITARDKHDDSVGEGNHPVQVHVSGPSGDLTPPVVDNGDGTYTVAYTPTEKGDHNIVATLHGEPIRDFPRVVEVLPTVIANTCTAEGPGLESPYTDAETHFVVTIRDKHGDQIPRGGFTVAVQIDETPLPSVVDNQDGTYTATYTPVRKGVHLIKVTCDGDDIEGSVFQVTVKPTPLAAHSTAEGQGVEPHHPENLHLRPTHFTIFSRDKNDEVAPEAFLPFTVAITGPGGFAVKSDILDNENGTYAVEYTPLVYGDHIIAVELAEQPIKASPFAVYISPNVSVGNSRASGPGVDGPVKVDKHAPFVIQAHEEDGTPISHGGFAFVVAVEASSGAVAADAVVDNQDGTYTSGWTPSVSGAHTVSVTHNGAHIHNSPFQLHVAPQPSAEHSFVEGPGLTDGFDNEPAHFTIHLLDKHKAPIPDGHPLVEINGPAPVAPHVTNNHDGTYAVEYSADDPGEYQIVVLTTDDGEGQHVRGSPSTAVIIPGADASGTPLGQFSLTIQAVDKHGQPKTVGGDRFEVTISHRAEKSGGETEVEKHQRDNGDGTYTVSYTLSGVGRFTVHVKLNGHHIRNSPFTHNLK